MRAMILAAGLGTRLKPLTDNLPKALVRINNQTLLEILIKKLAASGFDKIIINVHHFADQVTDYLSANKNFNVDITISDETGELLDTGGGLKKASWFFNDRKPFLVYNVDIISNIDLNKLYQFHLKSNSNATLAVRNRKSSRYFLFNEEHQLCGWKNEQSGEVKHSKPDHSNLKQLAFSGIQVIDPNIFELMPHRKVFSLVDVYLRVSSKKKVIGFLHDEDEWIDVGKPENLTKAETLLKKKKYT
jgi:NDP-sugar pyrophosphorylase family protein